MGIICLTVAVFVFSNIVLSTAIPTTTFMKGSDALLSAPLIDGHNDLPYSLYLIANNDLSNFQFEKNLTDDKTWGKDTCKACVTDLPHLTAGRVGAQFWAAYVDCKSQYKDAVELTLRQIDVIKRLVKKYSDKLEFVSVADDIEFTWKKGKIVSMIGIEGGHSLDSSLAVLRLYYELGVRYLTLTHTCNTPWADASSINDQFMYNLTEFGQIIVWEMNRLGMMIDLSHVSHNVMRNVLSISKSPIIFSHSSVFTLCNNYRNVPDDVLYQVKINNGIIMINFYNSFVNCDKSRNATLEDVVAHINYVKNLIGIDHVGIGADYNGVTETPIGLENVSKYPALFDRLYANKEGETEWSKDDLEKLAGRNLIRVFKEVESVRNSMRFQLPYENIISGNELRVAQENEKLKPGLCQTAKEWNNVKEKLEL
ncbi:PREDICTED: dipeptidase 1-like [Ceratosolen solmsi marchali]|uniref:Dipeptidase n=1 Tax=Ceratosolen solmsi marchali TaxID=326594 RepID=A0AAJ6YUN8_9HYME|nr:PREDICTED: dipeptidase 1-like [Ceratosolen solmsi marchali]